MRRWPSAALFAATLHRAVRIGFERTLEQDLGLGFRQLADPACKALSPAVNDPYTAIQAIDHLSVLFGTLGGAAGRGLRRPRWAGHRAAHRARAGASRRS